jgi:hypothetical protein
MMKNKIKIVLTLLFALGICKPMISQNIFPPTSMEVFLEIDPSDTTYAIGDTLFAATAKLNAKMAIVLQDTVHIDQIHVKLGTAANATQYLTKSFTFDISGVLPDGTEYLREGNVLYLKLGQYLGLNHFKASVVLENANSYLTSPVIYQR